MKSLTMLPVAAAFLGFLVAGAPFESEQKSIEVDLDNFCLYCETVPKEAREACYARCHVTTQDWVVLNDTVIANATLRAFMAPIDLPMGSKTTLKNLMGGPALSMNDIDTALATSPVVSNFSVEALGICDFCSDFAGKIGVDCHAHCHKHVPKRTAGNLHVKPWAVNAAWNLCEDGCTAHGCVGAYLASCWSTCAKCWDDNPTDIEEMGAPWTWPWGQRDYDTVRLPENAACFCPAQEFADRYEDDELRWEREIEEELWSDGDYDDGDHSDADIPTLCEQRREC